MPSGAAVFAGLVRLRVPFAPHCTLLLLTALSLSAAEDPKEIVRRALQINAHDSDLARNYTFLERTERRSVDSAGAIKSRESTTWDITLLEGAPYRRVIRRNDKPLSPKEEAKQEAELKKSAAERQKETPEQRQKRLATQDRERQQRQEELNEIPDAFDLRLVGEEQIDGMPVWVIDGTPRKNYKTKSRQVGFVTKVRGRMWVSQEDYRPVKIEAETIDTVSIGGILARIHKGFRIHLEFTRVNGEVWLPKFAAVAGSARLLLVKGLHIDQDFTFSNYRKFSAESRVIE